MKTIFFTIAVALGMIACESKRNDFESAAVAMQGLADGINFDLQQKYSGSKTIKVDHCIFKGSWGIQIYIKGLLPEEVDEVHKVVSSKLLSEGRVEVWALYLSDVIRINNEVMNRPEGNMELLKHAFLSKEGEWIDDAPPGPLTLSR